MDKQTFIALEAFRNDSLPKVKELIEFQYRTFIPVLEKIQFVSEPAALSIAQNLAKDLASQRLNFFSSFEQILDIINTHLDNGYKTIDQRVSEETGKSIEYATAPLRKRIFELQEQLENIPAPVQQPPFDEDLHDIVITLQKENALLGNQVLQFKKFETECTKLQSTIDSLQSEAVEFQTKHSKLQGEFDKLSYNFAELEALKDRLQKEINKNSFETLKNMIRERDLQIFGLREEMSKQNLEKMEKMSLSKRSSLLQVLEDSNAGLKADLASSKVESKATELKLQEEIKQLNSEITRLKASLQKAETEPRYSFETVKKLVQGKDNELKKYESEVSQLKTENTRLIEESKTTLGLFELLTEDNNRLKEENSSLLEELALLKMLMQKAQAEPKKDNKHDDDDNFSSPAVLQQLYELNINVNTLLSYKNDCVLFRKISFKKRELQLKRAFKSFWEKIAELEKKIIIVSQPVSTPASVYTSESEGLVKRWISEQTKLCFDYLPKPPTDVKAYGEVWNKLKEIDLKIENSNNRYFENIASTVEGYAAVVVDNMLTNNNNIEQKSNVGNNLKTTSNKIPGVKPEYELQVVGKRFSSFEERKRIEKPLDETEMSHEIWLERCSFKSFISNTKAMPYDSMMCQGEWSFQKNVNQDLNYHKLKALKMSRKN
jgi:hypothetical protein